MKNIRRIEYYKNLINWNKTAKAFLVKAVENPNENSESPIYEVKPDNGEFFTLKELQDAVGGSIEIMPSYKPDYVIVGNEEGKLIGLNPNPKATAHFRYECMFGLVGDCIITHKSLIK